MSLISRCSASLGKKKILSLTNLLLVNNNIVNHSNAIPVFIKQKEITPSWRRVQHQRFCCETRKQKECWNCKSNTKSLNLLICNVCGKLQDLTDAHDFFELLSLPRDFDIHTTKLTKTFRQLQTLVHPDKFANKSEREQVNSAEWSALVNKAYKTLSQPLFRGQYLLELQGEKMPHDNSTLNEEFLMEMMERNEEVEDAEAKADLLKMNHEVQADINEEISQLTEFFRSNDLSAAKAVLVKLKYLYSIQGSIQTKLEKLMNI